MEVNKRNQVFEVKFEGTFSQENALGSMSWQIVTQLVHY